MNQVLERILLHHLEGSRAGQVDSFTQPVIVIGRAPDCHLVLDADKGVSGHHCEIRQAGGQFELVDSNSTNGTFIGDERIASHVLNSGDSIRFGWMGPLARVEFDAAVRSVHPDHPIDNSQSTVMVSARHIAAAAAAGAQAAAAQAAPMPKEPQITMPPPSRAPAPPAPPSPARAAPPPAASPMPAAVPLAAAPARAPAPPPRTAASPPATAQAGWSTARWIVAITVVVAVGAAAAFGLWLMIG